MAARDGKSRFASLLGAAAKDLLEHFKRKNIRGERSDRQPEDWCRAHGVDVGDGVGRGNRSEQIRIVDNRREEIDRLRDRLIAVDPQDGRIVAGVVTDEKIPQPFSRREFRQDGVKVILTQLAGSTARRGERREGRITLDLSLHA